MSTRKKMATLLEAVRWAPSSFNEQLWSFILATKDYCLAWLIATEAANEQSEQFHVDA
jgi:nitroreductase